MSHTAFPAVSRLESDSTHDSTSPPYATRVFANDPVLQYTSSVCRGCEFRASVVSYAKRVQKRVEITTFGRDFACTHLIYERVNSGAIGRETKIMARLPDGWHVVSAHVSLLAAKDETKRK